MKKPYFTVTLFAKFLGLYSSKNENSRPETHLTVTDLAKFLGLSGSLTPRSRAK